MTKFDIKISFELVQPDFVATMWTEGELRIALEEELELWAGKVDGELGSIDITVSRSKANRPVNDG